MRVSPQDRSALLAARDRRRRRLTALRRRLAGLQRAPDRGGLRIRRAGHRAALATAAGVVVAAAFGVTLVAGGLPALEALAGPPTQPRVLPADTLITDAAGNLIADVHEPGVNRLPVPLSQVSAYFREAIVAVEDRNFWSEGAVDPLRLAEAAWSDLSSGRGSQGASTIPMQLAKLLYLSDNHSLSYKVREIAYANDLMKQMSHAQILEDYVNDVPFGNGAVGVQAAAERYFGIPASQLDLTRSALLAGLPQAPGVDDPRTDPQAAHNRELSVLGAMERAGDINPDQVAAAAAEPLHLGSADIGSYDLYPAFTARVVEEVQAKLHLNPVTAGLRITATLDPNLEKLAQGTVSQQIAALAGKHVTDGALVSIDPTTGDVLAYVGNAGSDVPGADYDMAAVPRQMGSSFKLFTYPTALAQRQISMLTPVLDGPISIPLSNGQTYQPTDYDHTWHGIVPIELALGNSLNVPAIRVELLAGIPNVVATARKMGVTTLTQPASSYGPSMTLGTYPVPLWEMAQAATAYADQGVMHDAEFVREVTTEAGRVLYRGSSAGKPVMDPGVAFIMNQILSTDANRVMEFGAGSDLTLAGHVVAAKTGTTQDFRDNITVGWTPHLVTATWVGNADDSPMQGTTGITGAAPIWHDFMTAALRGTSDAWPGPPSDVVQEAAGGGAPDGQFQPDVASGQAGWFLTGTDWTTGAQQLSGQAGPGAGTTNVSYQGDCRYWTYQGGNYRYCGSGMSNLPGDPGPQPGGGGPSPPAPPPGPGGGHKHHRG